MAEKPLLQDRAGQLEASSSRLCRPLQIILDRTARRPERAPDLPSADTVKDKPEHLSNLSHDQFSLGGHQPFLVDNEGPHA
jgi:hypothetical protein